MIIFLHSRCTYHVLTSCVLSNSLYISPASFGLEGFEDAVWEAIEDLLAISPNANKNHAPEDHSNSVDDDGDDYCKAITFIVAAPDLFTDPALLEGIPRALSPQAEFEPDKFQEFSSTLRGKLAMFSQVEGMPLNDTIELEAFHPLYRSDMKLNRRTKSSRPISLPMHFSFYKNWGQMI